MTSASATTSITFIDTNVWLYAFNNTQDPVKTRRAKEIIRTEAAIVVSTQVINEVSYNLIRKFSFDEGQVRRLIRSYYRRYIVVEFENAILLEASRIRLSYKLSFWDSLIVASAISAGASKLYSEDMHDSLTIDTYLTIINPFKPKT